MSCAFLINVFDLSFSVATFIERNKQLHWVWEARVQRSYTVNMLAIIIKSLILLTELIHFGSLMLFFVIIQHIVYETVQCPQYCWDNCGMVYLKVAQDRETTGSCQPERGKTSLKTRRVIPPSACFLFITLGHKENGQGR